MAPTYIDLLLERGEQMRSERRRQAESLIPGKRGGASLEFQLYEMDMIEVEERRQSQQTANFGKPKFVPVGYTQRSLDELEDERAYNPLQNEPAHTAIPFRRQQMTRPEPPQPNEGREPEGDAELMGGDLDAAMEDLDAFIEEGERMDDDLGESSEENVSGGSSSLGLDGTSVEMQEGPSQGSAGNESRNMST